MLIVEDLDKLKITSIKNVIHFKYDNDYYFIHEGGDYTRVTCLYRGRCRSKDNECIKSIYGFIPNLIKHKYNKNTLNSIDKNVFVKKLYRAGLIDTTIKEIINKVKIENERTTELKKIIEQANRELREINFN